MGRGRAVGIAPMSWTAGLAAIQAIAGWVEVCGRRHMLSQAYICPDCCCWLVMMS
jgi:hypothetical protein